MRGTRMAKKDIPSGHHITYQRQYRTCGKPSCGTCQKSDGHGPYWYAYWRENGKLKSTYVGKTLPDGANNSETEAVS